MVRLPCWTIGSRKRRSKTVAVVVVVTAAGGVVMKVQTYPKPWLATCGQFVTVVGVIRTWVAEEGSAVSTRALRMVAPGRRP